MSKRKVRVLVVDDSAFMRTVITDLLTASGEIEVVGVARNGIEALERVRVLRPDVVTLDVEMPKMDGLETLEHLMRDHPTPVVMLSSVTKDATESTLQAMERGAVDFVTKPGGTISLHLKTVECELIEKVKEAAKVQMSCLTSSNKGVRRSVPRSIDPPARKKMIKVSQNNNFSKRSKTFVIIGTSTGGPRALQEVLTNLPAELGAPLLIVQHMPPGFTKSLAQRLDKMCAIRVKEAEDGETIQNNVAYIAPGEAHLKFKRFGSTYTIQLDDREPPRKAHRPAVDVLLESAASERSLQYITVIMTGMGNDGTEGVKTLKRQNERTHVIAESEKTAVIYGMPKAIVEAGLAEEVKDLPDIAPSIVEMLRP
ncbi:MAG TPA: chemotaxis response regulator protein-glutamate methylesterase [Savagea sp.]